MISQVVLLRPNPPPTAHPSQSKSNHTTPLLKTQGLFDPIRVFTGALPPIYSTEPGSLQLLRHTWALAVPPPMLFPQILTQLLLSPNSSLLFRYFCHYSDHPISNSSHPIITSLLLIFPSNCLSPCATQDVILIYLLCVFPNGV